MIELKDNRLVFSFPEIAEEIQTLAEGYIKETLPRILAEDRAEALASIAERTLKAERQSEASDQLRRIETPVIETELRKRVLEKLRGALGGDFELSLSGVPPCGRGGVRFGLGFQRTLRIPDDGHTYPLPAGLGEFPLHHVDDLGDRLPEDWGKRGGVVMPMYQSEALWVSFDSRYPFAVKIGAGKINAIDGRGWSDGLERKPQNYLVLPGQPWLDGFSVGAGVIRQFVAMPLGQGYSAEEQLTGRAEFGGIQVQAYPMKGEVFFERNILPRLPSRLAELIPNLLPPEYFHHRNYDFVCYSMREAVEDRDWSMGLGAGGLMRQEIYEDNNPAGAWNSNLTSRCFVHLCNSGQWAALTGRPPPHQPMTPSEYAKFGIPWFDHYRDDLKALEGSTALANLNSLSQVASHQGKMLPGNSLVKPPDEILPTTQTPRPRLVREW